jgi:hypothetical protein
MATELTDWAKRGIAGRPIEADLVNKVIDGLAAAGKPVVKVFDHEQYHEVETREDILNLVFNLDEAYLIPEEGGYVWLVMGEGWTIITDYTLNLEDALSEVNEYVQNNW